MPLLRFLFVFGCMIAFAVVSLVPTIAGENELLSKTEWSIVQSVEFKHRSQPLSLHMILKEEAGRHLVGIVSIKGTERVWIMLDPVHQPYLKQIPAAEYQIDLMELDRIFSFCKVHSEVKIALSKMVKSLPRKN